MPNYPVWLYDKLRINKAFHPYVVFGDNWISMVRLVAITADSINGGSVLHGKILKEER